MPASSTPLDSVTGASLLAATGGMLDVIVYVGHGHVFACAMTGNVVLMGIAALERDWMQVCRHLAPLVAFFFGVAGSMFLRERRAFITGLTLEIMALMIAAVLPDHFPSILFSSFVALFGSLQSATFRQVDRFSYNSTFVTGNLRTAAEGAYEVFFGRQTARKADPVEKGRLQAHELGLICLAFFAGALLGAWLEPHFGNRSLWAVVVLLIAALARALRAERMQPMVAAAG
jgi:uncharacterized membrane protein YoaK (UPF0700 family)